MHFADASQTSAENKSPAAETNAKMHRCGIAWYSPDFVWIVAFGTEGKFERFQGYLSNAGSIELARGSLKVMLCGIEWQHVCQNRQEMRHGIVLWPLIFVCLFES